MSLDATTTQQIAEAEAQQRTESGEELRTKVLLQARTSEAGRAEMRAEQRAREAESARAAADAALAEARRLDAELKDLQAKQTELGLVLTLGDVLFDTDKAQLRSGADPTIDRLTEFLSEYPERNVLIVGDNPQGLLTDALRRRDGRPFGACKTCRYFQPSVDGGKPHRCGLLEEPLSTQDSQLVCVEQESLG